MKWYNSERSHEHLHYVAPDDYEKNFSAALEDSA